jgi:hypothetical protein
MLLAVVFAAVILLVAGNSLAATVSEGKPLPDFKMELASQQDMRDYLGIESGPEFTISQIPSRFVLVEFFSVLCKACHQNAPQVNKIYQVISDDPELLENVKMLGIALCNDGKMADGYKKTFKVKFPIVNDPEGEIDRLFPDMTTPCLILADDKGMVLFVHEGVIDDPDTILTMIRRFYSQQPASSGR